MLELGRLTAPSASLHSEEDLAILEQLCIASLDVSNLEVAESVVTRLESRFEDSSRVMRLRGPLRGIVYEAITKLPSRYRTLQKPPREEPFKRLRPQTSLRDKEVPERQSRRSSPLLPRREQLRRPSLVRVI